MLLGELKEKLTSQITYETKRNIFKQLVREIVVCTIHFDERDTPEVDIHIKFVFPQIVPYTEKGSCNYLGEIVFKRPMNQDV